MPDETGTMVELVGWASATWGQVGFHASLWVGFLLAIVVFAVALIRDLRKSREGNDALSANSFADQSNDS